MSRPGPEQRPSQRTLVIIPTYNERENLPLIVGRVHAARPSTPRSTAALRVSSMSCVGIQIKYLTSVRGM